MVSQIKTKIRQPHVQFIFINFFTSVQQLCVGFLNVSAKQKATIARAVYGHVQTSDISASKNSFYQQATALEIACVPGGFVGFSWTAAEPREERGQRRENRTRPHSSRGSVTGHKTTTKPPATQVTLEMESVGFVAVLLSGGLSAFSYLRFSK